jgi:uncharacterized membrane protein SirB2
MAALYPQIKLIHILAVILSGSLFALRGALTLAGSRLAQHSVPRRLAYAIDTVLLAAALMLTTIVHQYPFVQAWLTVKVLLLVVYIVLGRSRSSAAARRASARSPTSRRSRCSRSSCPWRARTIRSGPWPRCCASAPFARCPFSSDHRHCGHVAPGLDVAPGHPMESPKMNRIRKLLLGLGSAVLLAARRRPRARSCRSRS